MKTTRSTIKIELKKTVNSADIETVGCIVPLPNHYTSNSLKGHGPVKTGLFLYLEARVDFIAYIL